MATSDAVEIKLKVSAAEAITGLASIKSSVDDLSTSFQGMANSLNFLALANGIMAAKDAASAFSASIGIATSTMLGAAAVGVALQQAIAYYTETQNIATRAMTNLGDATANTAKKLKSELRDALKSSLIDEEEFTSATRRVAEAMSFSQDVDKAAAAMTKATHAIRELIVWRQKLHDVENAWLQSRSIAAKSNVSFGEARGSLADAESNAGFNNPEDAARFEEQMLSTARELSARRVKAIEADQAVSEKRIKDMSATPKAADENQVEIILEQAKLDQLGQMYEAEWLSLSAKEIEIKRMTLERKQALVEQQAQREAAIYAEEQQAQADLIRFLREAYETDRARIEGNDFISDVEKRRQTIESLKRQIEIIGPQDPKSKGAREQLALLQSQADPESWKQQTLKSFVDFRNQLGTMAQSIGAVFVSPIKGVFDGLQSSISGLIQGTMTWKQAMANLGKTILESVAQAFAQLIAKAIVMFLILKPLSLIPGVGSFIGAAGFLGGGKASGGPVGTGLYAVGEQGTEYVVNNPTLARFGTGFFDSLQRGGSAPASAPSGGGGAPVTIAFFGSKSEAQRYLDSTDGEGHVVDIVSRNIHRFRS